MYMHLEHRTACALYCLKLYPCYLRLELVDVPELMKKTGEQLTDLTRLQINEANMLRVYPSILHYQELSRKSSFGYLALHGVNVFHC